MMNTNDDKILLVNILKQKIFMRLWSSFKFIGDAHPELLILKDQDCLPLIVSIQKTIGFYLKIYGRILDQEKKGEINNNKYSFLLDISCFLKGFYFKTLFMNFALNDLALIKENTTKMDLGFLKALLKVLQLDYFKSKFEIINTLGMANFEQELEDFTTNFLRISVNSYFEVTFPLLSFKLL